MSEYRKLCKAHGQETVDRVLVAKLRAMADAIERGHGPYMMDCIVQNMDGRICLDTIETLSVTMSHPWGG